MRNFKILIALVSLFLAACDLTPMQKLANDTVYPDIDNAFWAKEHKNHTQLWDEGLAYCKEHNSKPNCGGLWMIYMLSNSSHVLTGKLNSHPIKMPTF